MTVMLQAGPGVSATVLVELDRVWWDEYARTFPALFLSESPSRVWCVPDERLLKRLILADGYSFRADDSSLGVSDDTGRSVAILPAVALVPLAWVSVSLGLDGVPVLSIFGKVFPIAVTPMSYVDDDGRLGAPRGSFLERWGVADLLRIKAIADYWR